MSSGLVSGGTWQKALMCAVGQKCEYLKFYRKIMVVGSIISIIFTDYCDENKRNKVKISV